MLFLRLRGRRGGLSVSSNAAVASIALTDLERRLVEQAVLIRVFESSLLELFAAGKLNGTVHTCVGQEFVAVTVGAALGEADLVVSNHRGHGHYLAIEPDLDGLLAEVMGRVDGVCGGAGGSQHLIGQRFLSSGIQAGMTPIAVGAALAAEREATGGIVVAYIGDGTLGEGLLYESVNLASLWQVPVLFVVENNRYAQSTATTTTIAGSVAGRAAAFGLPYHQGDTWNWRGLMDVAANAVEQVRSTRGPAVLEVSTYRLNAHSKGDDNRDAHEVSGFRERDPVQQLIDSEQAWVADAVGDARARVSAAIARAEESAHCRYTPHPAVSHEPVTFEPVAAPAARHVDRIHAALAAALAEDPRVVILGEDIEGSYGGAFKVTRDLSLEHPGRVRNTPISEAAIVGMGTGLAFRGAIPVVEIMFGDFLTLTLDQLQQHAAKFRDMYGGKVSVPLIVRTPMGGRRGYGPTHSQSIEKHFLGIPGLEVIALNNRLDPAQVYGQLFATITDPTLVVENKTLYTRFVDDTAPAGFVLTASTERFPTVRISPDGITPEVTVVCYGGMLEEAEAAQTVLFEEHEIAVEIVCPTALHPCNLDPIAASVAVSERLVVVEEGPDFAGFGAEVIANLVQQGVRFKVARRGHNGIVPASASRERELLVDAGTIVELANGLLDD
jgi:2-oxoisovalerate dehydrogenase E1 component